MLEPAESESLITVGPAGVEFAHPLLRSVAYQRHPDQPVEALTPPWPGALPASSAREAGLALAAATLEPDEEVARELEIAATEASRRAAPTTAARGFEAAAR